MLALGGLLALLIVAVTVALVVVVVVRRDESSLSARDVPYTSAVAAAALNAKGIATDQRGFLLTGDRTFIDEAEQRVDQARTAFAEAQQQAANSTQRAAVGQASTGFENWVQAIEKEFATYTTGNRDAAITAAFGSERQIRKAYERSLAAAQAAGQRSIHAATTSANATSNRSQAILIATLVAAIVAGTAIVYWLFHTIALPLYSLASLLTSS